MLIYAATVFLSAFLLFQVQPLIAKFILPWFGGSAAVWSAALLFFQLLLLGGYFYAHVLIRYLKPKMQLWVHGGLLAVSLLTLPIIPTARWKPTAIGDPTFNILILLAAVIGLPYMLLSATSPLLQAWYVRVKHGALPYRLFALSNFGSFLALLSYPFVIEPRLTLSFQAKIWSSAYVAFALACAAAAWRSSSAQDLPPVTSPQEDGGKPPTLANKDLLDFSGCLRFHIIVSHHQPFDPERRAHPFIVGGAVEHLFAQLRPVLRKRTALSALDLHAASGWLVMALYARQRAV